MNRSGLEVKLTIPQEREISGIYEWSAIYRVPDPLVFHWSETVRFTLRVRPTTLPLGGLANKPVRIEQDCFVEAESSRLTTISSLHEALYDLELLVCLLSGFPGSLTLTSCSSPCAVGPDGRIRSLALQFDKQSDDEVNAANLDWERALVPYPKVQERFTDLVPRWRDVLDVQGKVVHAYFAGRHARHAEEQLLACANALQRLVESSEGRQSFERSVSQVIGCYLAPATATQSIQLLTKTRHYLTHYNPAENQDAARGAQLANLVDMVDAMVRCKLLELLGFSVDEIKGFIRDNYEFSKRITMNRWSEH